MDIVYYVVFICFSLIGISTPQIWHPVFKAKIVDPEYVNERTFDVFYVSLLESERPCRNLIIDDSREVCVYCTLGLCDLQKDTTHVLITLGDCTRKYNILTKPYRGIKCSQHMGQLLIS